MREPPPLVDSHCHLTDLEAGGVDVAQVLARAHAAGVHQVVTSADGVEEGRRALELADRFPEVFVTIGWHPARPGPPDDRQAAALDDLLGHPRVVGVGEVGLDHHQRPGVAATPRALQLEQWRVLLQLATRRRLGVVVHDRLAHAEVMDELLRWPGTPALLHCFSGDAAMARAAARRGLVVSFSGIVTFRNAAEMRLAAAAAPDGGFVVETDSPFLTPEPFRGRPNEPHRVAVTAAKLAELRGQDVAAVAAATTAAARAFYHLPEPPA